MARPSASDRSANRLIADLGEEGEVSEIGAEGTMANEDASVCTPDPLPDAAASILIPRGEAIPVRKLGGERDLFGAKLDGVADVMRSRLRPTASDSEEREEAAPLALGEGSLPSIATIAVLLAVPPLLEVSPNRAVSALPSVDISPPGGMRKTTFFCFSSTRRLLLRRASYG
jgi:hypothetical protein